MFTKVDDKELKVWIFDTLNRGITYSLRQKFTMIIDVLETFWKFISGFVRMFFFYFDIYKDILAFVVFDHISHFEGGELVSCLYDCFFLLIKTKINSEVFGKNFFFFRSLVMMKLEE